MVINRIYKHIHYRIKHNVFTIYKANQLYLQYVFKNMI